MIQPTSITKFDRTDLELQTFWLFSMFVAGKDSDFAASKVAALLDLMPVGVMPLQYMCGRDVNHMLRQARVGQYNRLTRAIIGSMSIDLRKASVEDLMSIHGIGPKTARFFILHSRKDCDCAVLDVHILKFLRANGYLSAPMQTPTGKRYLMWEMVFLNICKLKYPHKSAAEIDLSIWTEYSGRAA